MTTNKRSSKRTIRVPIRFGDSVQGITKKNGVVETGSGETKDNDNDKDGIISGSSMGRNGVKKSDKKGSFEGDLNGDGFPTLNSQVSNSSSSANNLNNVLNKDGVDGLNACEKLDGIDTDMNCTNANNNAKIVNACVSNDVTSVETDGSSAKVIDVNEEAIVDKQQNRSDCKENAEIGLENNNERNRKLVDIVKNASLDNKLLLIPTEITEDGHEVAVFDEENVELGSAKWNRTVCGQFLGCTISFNEVKYHLRRMWYKYGLEDITVNNKGVFFFKFHDEQGISEVISNGPWMVNNKPMFVQRWSVDVCLDNSEPVKLPVWIKLLNIPLEAWSVRGISKIASCLGKPIIMDDVTTKMCMTG